MAASEKRVRRGKENSDFDWRREEIKASPVRSRGIAPKSFHAATRRQCTKITELHSDVIKKEKQKVIKNNEILRGTFKKVTSLKTWPVQEQAFRDLKDLMKQHLHAGDGDGDGDGNEQIESSPKENPSTTGDSSISSSSKSSVEEHKRLMRGTGLSPAQSTMQAHCIKEFLAEKVLSKPLSIDHSFGSPLWSMEPRIFSKEKSKAGKRKYVVGNFGRFLDMYWRKADPQHRHYYELIRENTPCRLYLDLEFSKVSNPSISDQDAEDMLQELLLEICFELEERFGLSGVRKSHVVDLDSSAAAKFSRHWIFHLPGGFLFPHTAAMGYFMTELISRLAQDQATGCLAERRPLLHKYLLVKVSPSNVDADKTTCFIDAGVYTRNRLFRLLGSSKFGKPPSAALRIAETNEFPFPKGFTNESFYLPAMARARARERRKSAGEDSDDGHDTDDYEVAVQQFVASNDWSRHAIALAETLVVPLNASKIDYPVFPFDEELLRKPRSIGGQACNRKTIASTSMSYGQSPYPLIDNFVLNELATRGGIQGSIRAWSIIESSSAAGEPIQIIYQMSRNRWCECIGRSHKSNNIAWTVDLQLWHCVQSCHDPDCRAMSFRGTPVPLPNSVREEMEEILFEEGLARIDETKLLEQRELSQQAKSSTSTNNSTTSSAESDEEVVERAFATLSIDSTEKEVSAMKNDKIVSPYPEVVTALMPYPPRKVSPKSCGDDEDDSSDDDIDLVALMKQKQVKLPTARKPITMGLSNQCEDEADDADSSLSDEALLDAICSNPDLFP